MHTALRGYLVTGFGDAGLSSRGHLNMGPAGVRFLGAP